MAEYKPSFPFDTAIELLIPTYSSVKGVQTKTFPDNGERLNCSFKTYGGQEITTNGAYTIIDTALIETWYRPDIKSDCRVKLLATGQVYEILGKPENINMRNQFLKFKVRAVEGGA
jgi:SPP1 family predicted phage head-tail adaptor